MSRIEFSNKPDSGDRLWTDKSGSQVFVARDYARQNEIQESLDKRNSRTCFKACLTCGSCANSRRGCSSPYRVDHSSGVAKNIDCRRCEPFRYHDCHNGWMRNSRGEAEPFSKAQLDLIKMAETGKPLID